ncbi:hypothetical protein H2248_002788 [Termitomyces sp. 'cryptogamus']|nr:hypothetical protein H2248_002788 [Termitomyces sp. 'cryptogamus']
MINALYSDLSVHVTVEFRVFPSIGKTIQYAKMLDLTGAQIITCHGRTHEQRGKKYWSRILRTRRSCQTRRIHPSLRERQAADVQRCIDETGADGDTAVRQCLPVTQ